jgi:hypothetical protein
MTVHGEKIEGESLIASLLLSDPKLWIPQNSVEEPRAAV